MTDDRQAVADALAALGTSDALQRAPGPAIDARFIGADGRIHPLSLHLGFLGTSTGDRTNIICVVRDRARQRRTDRRERIARISQATASTTDTVTGLLNDRGLDLAIASATALERPEMNSPTP